MNASMEILYCTVLTD